jgi:hypothetical protein
MDMRRLIWLRAAIRRVASVVEESPRKPVSTVRNQMVAVQILQFLAYFLKGESPAVEETHLLLDFVIDVGVGGHHADAVIVFPQRDLLAVEAADYSVEDVEFLGI